MLAVPEGRGVARPLPARPAHRGATSTAATRRWPVHVWSGDAGEVATGVVDDARGRVLEAWTGPQVAWKMARGRPGAFGGRTLTSWPVWLALSAVFLLALADLRRPLALRNLDLLVLLSFGVSLAFFNRGEVFRQRAARYPPLLYLLARTAWIGFRRRRPPRRRDRCGRSGSLAAVGDLPRRPARGPQRRGAAIGDRRRVRRRDRRRPHPRRPGAVRAHARRGRPHAVRPGRLRGRDPAADPGRTDAARRPTRGETHTGRSPISPTCRRCSRFGWSGRWDSLPAAHATAIALDLLTLAGLAARRRRASAARVSRRRSRSRGPRIPFTAYALLANTNDALMPAAARLGLLARLLAVGARRGRRARGLVEVRGPAPGAALARRIRTGSASRRLRASPPRSRSPRPPSSRCSCSSPISEMRCGRSGTARSGSSSIASRRSRSGAGASTTQRGIPDLGWLQTALQPSCRRWLAVVARSGRGSAGRSSSRR